jgi:apolipoprotein D and lipocalin family protein
MNPTITAIIQAFRRRETLPEGAHPVEGFALESYLGLWYEVARLDHFFERGLSNVTAHYSLRADGLVKVLNRGYDERAGKWRRATGRARFAGPRDVGRLEVSFFGPFYGAYVILELDRENHRHAMVCGPDRSYLWLLSRTPTLDETVRAALLEKAARLGFDIGALVWVDHSHDGENRFRQ